MIFLGFKQNLMVYRYSFVVVVVFAMVFLFGFVGKLATGMRQSI